MIYIFKGCSAVCTAPCKACDAACKSCNGACKCLEDGWKGMCQALSDCFAPIINNPLGGYVIGTWCVNGLILVAAGGGLMKLNSAEPACDGNVSIFAMAMVALAIIHSAFAFYLQRRLVAEIGAESYQSMTHKEIASKAQHVMLYDVAFCLYVFVFFGAFFYTCSGIGDLNNCAASGPVWSAAALMIVYVMVAGNYAFCWYCGQCCCGGIEQKSSLPGAIIGRGR